MRLPMSVGGCDFALGSCAGRRDIVPGYARGIEMTDTTHAKHGPGVAPAQAPSGRDWTEHDMDRLIEMWHRGRSNAEIAKALDRAPNAVAVKASRLGLPPKARAEEARRTGKRRACLCCRRMFDSTGPGHRICDICKSSPEWRDPDIFHVSIGGF